MTDIAKSKLTYDPDTGKLCRNGREAGWLGQNGYRYVSFGNKKHLTHRVAWLLHHGEWPERTIDHINRDTLDNRMCNLRDVDMSTQGHNQRIRKDNTSGHKNVYFHRPSGLWVVLVFNLGKQTCVGYFRDKAQAVLARDRAKLELAIPQWT